MLPYGDFSVIIDDRSLSFFGKPGRKNTHSEWFFLEYNRSEGNCMSIVYVSYGNENITRN